MVLNKPRTPLEWTELPERARRGAADCGELRRTTDFCRSLERLIFAWTFSSGRPRCTDFHAFADAPPFVNRTARAKARLPTLRVLLLTGRHAVVHTPILIYNAMSTPGFPAKIFTRLRSKGWNRSAKQTEPNGD
jgi:hypothetical protein